MTKDSKPYYQQYQPGIAVQQMQPEHAERLEALQRIVFPALAEDELIKSVHYLRHLQIFPEGQFVITDGNEVIGMTSTMRSAFNDNHHTFKETIAGGWLTNHNPCGDWLYGLDLGIHPNYRGKGLARSLYKARHMLVQSLQLKGQFTVGMMNGYGVVAETISAQQYFEELKLGNRTDPTLTPQMKIGFEPICLIPNYLNDPTCGGYGVLIKMDIDKKM